MLLEPEPKDVPGVAELRAWYEHGGAAQAPQALTQAGRGGGSRNDRRVTVAMIKDEVRPCCVTIQRRLVPPAACARLIT